MDGMGNFEYHFTRQGALRDPRERKSGEPMAMMLLVSAQPLVMSQLHFLLCELRT
jgi:hypothetical protein